MNATMTSVKCRCQNCNGHLEFDASAAGQTITCPHCSLDTTLYIPGSAAPQAAASRPRLEHLPLRLGNWRKTIVIVALAVLAITAVAAVVLTIILWIFFPVWLYFAMGRIETHLRHIEQHSGRS